MRKLLWICVLASGVMLVQAASAAAQTSVIMRATLTGGEETPNLVLSGAVAVAEVALDPTSQEIAVRLRVFNLPNGSTASHIHVVPKGDSAPVVIDFPIGTRRPGDFHLNFRPP